MRLNLLQQRAKAVVDNLVGNFIELFFPRRCLNCGSVGGYLCSACLDKVRPSEIQPCCECRRAALGGFTHPLCLSRYSPERSITVFKFEGPIREAILQLKYDGVKDLTSFLADLTVEVLGESGVEIGLQSLLVPVPIHPIRQLERGFNQSSLLALYIGQRLGITVWEDLLIKVKDNTSQTRLNLTERRQNVRGAYRIGRRDSRRRLIRGRDVIILDDVYTSGATLRECARVVKKAGARFVYLLAIAKD